MRRPADCAPTTMGGATLATTFEDARPEVYDVVCQVISETEEHGWLARYRMALVFRCSDKGSDNWGKSQVLTGLAKFLSGDRDAVIVIERLAWTLLDEPRRRALIDHLLSHFGANDDGDLCIVKPDVAEFSSVIARHGLWHVELERMAEAMRPHAVALDLGGEPDPEGAVVDEIDRVLATADGN